MWGDIYYGSFTQRTNQFQAPPEFTVEGTVLFTYDSASGEGTLFSDELFQIFNQNRIKFIVKRNESGIGDQIYPSTFSELTDFTQVYWVINEDYESYPAHYSASGFYAWTPLSFNGDSWSGEISNLSEEEVVSSGTPPIVSIERTYGDRWRKNIELIAHNLDIGQKYTVQSSRDLKEWDDHEDIVGMTTLQSWRSDLEPVSDNSLINLHEGNWFFRLLEK